jgi:hypothetical protein
MRNAHRLETDRIARIAVLAVAACALTGCAARPASVYRLMPQGSHQLLVPPGVVHADTPTQSFSPDVKAASDPCPVSDAVSLRVRRKKLKATVIPATLATQPPGWMREWAETLEAKGCIPVGSALAFADEIVESVPLDPIVAFRLLHANLVDLAPGTRIQVVSPVLQEGTAPDTPLFEPVQTSETASGLNLALKASSALIGRETDLYDVRSRTEGAGVIVVPLTAERKIQDRTEQIAAPATNYFRFSPAAAYYRLFYKGSESGFTALIIAAPTYAELEKRMTVLNDGVASCDRVGAEWCVAVPKLVGFNIVLSARVNGVEASVRYGATVGEVIRGTGERRPESVLDKLSVYRNYRGRSVAIQFDRTSPGILEVPLLGGETISWK